MEKSLIEKIKDFISKDKIDQALGVLKNLVKESKETFRNQLDWPEIDRRLILLSSRYNRIKTSHDKAIISDNDYQNSMTKIADGLLTLIREIEEFQAKIILSNKHGETKSSDSVSNQSPIGNPVIQKVLGKISKDERSETGGIAETITKIKQEHEREKARKVASYWLKSKGKAMALNSLKEACEKEIMTPFCNDKDSKNRLDKCIKILIQYIIVYFSDGQDPDITDVIEELESDNILCEEYYHILANVFSFFLIKFETYFSDIDLKESPILLDLIREKIQAYQVFFKGIDRLG